MLSLVKLVSFHCTVVSMFFLYGQAMKNRNKKGDMFILVFLVFVKIMNFSLPQDLNQSSLIIFFIFFKIFSSDKKSFWISFPIIERFPSWLKYIEIAIFPFPTFNVLLTRPFVFIPVATNMINSVILRLHQEIIIIGVAYPWPKFEKMFLISS